MPILKPGFTPGFRGRKTQASVARRAHYLVQEHDRDSARVLGAFGQELTPAQITEILGGRCGEYHEVIVAPSSSECRAISDRNPEHQQMAVSEAGLRLAKAHAMGRPFVLAIHEQGGRFHYHLLTRGPMAERTLSAQGSLQKLWDRELFGDEPRIQDWQAHQRFLAQKGQLKDVIREQRQNERGRRGALQNAPAGRKSQVARPFELKARELIERRYQLEVGALAARYQSRGTLGGPRHLAELQQVEHRRTGALRRLDRREGGRALATAQRASDRVADGSSRMAVSAVRTAGRVTRIGVEGVLRMIGAPRTVRIASRVALAIAQEGLTALIRASMEAAKAAAHSGVYTGKAAVELAIGLIGALPTKGTSLKEAGKEAGRDLGEAGKEAAQGLLSVSTELGKGAARATQAGAKELLPMELRAGLAAGSILAQTGAGAARDLITLSPVDLGKTLVGGVVELGQTAAHGTGALASLPAPIRRAFQVAGWAPVVGPIVKALELTATLTHSAISAASRGLEVDR